MKSLAHKQTTTHPSSHDEDGACEGGRNGYPSDHQAFLNKLHVGLSDNRDRAEETLGSETSRPVSGRTRIKKRSEASRYSNQNRDDSAGPSNGYATNTPRSMYSMHMLMSPNALSNKHSFFLQEAETLRLCAITASSFIAVHSQDKTT